MNSIDDYLFYLDYLDDIYSAIQNLDLSVDVDLSGLDIPDYSTAINNISTRITSINTTLTNISTQISSNLHSNFDVELWEMPAYKWVYNMGYSSGQYTAWTSYSQYGMMFKYTEPIANPVDNVSEHFVYWNNKLYSGDRYKSQPYVIAFFSTTQILASNFGWVYQVPLQYNFESAVQRHDGYGKDNGLYINYYIISPPEWEGMPDTYDNAITFYFSQRILIAPIYCGFLNTMPDDVRALLGIDKPEVSLLEQIRDGIQGMSGTDYDTTQYESYEQSIDGLNDNMRDRFDNIDEQFQNNINTILTPDQTSGGSNTIFQQFHFNDINSVFNGFLNDIFTIAPSLKYILLFGLLLLVLGVLI